MRFISQEVHASGQQNFSWKDYEIWRSWPIDIIDLDRWLMPRYDSYLFLNLSDRVSWERETYCEDFEHLFGQIESMWNGHLVNSTLSLPEIRSFVNVYATEKQVYGNPFNKQYKLSWLDTRSYVHSIIPRPKWQVWLGRPIRIRLLPFFRGHF